MSKKSIMISIDEFVHSKAKAKHFNISDICERALRRKVDTNIKDAPAEALVLKCSECGSIIDFGFLCEISNKFFCSNCQEKCRFFDLKEHSHIRIPGLDGQNTDLMKKVAENSSEREK